MQQDLAAFRASKGAAGGAPAATATPPAPVAPVVSDNPIDADLKKYRAQKSSGTLPKKAPKEGGNALADFAKSIFSAPATIVARPFQAVAAIGGASNQQIDEATKKIPILGDLIAPTPNTYADVGKDIGRAAQTVALGTGAPIAGGALFGAGASLEQGNDLLSTQTAFNTVLGAAGGKILGLVGKPLLNAAGKVVGTITPKILKDVAAGGSEAITKFAADHQLLGGIAAKPSAKLAAGLQAVDDKIGAGTSKVFTGVKNVASEQFPQLSPTEHYKSVNAKDIIRPTTVNEPKYSKATAVYNDAKGRGIDLEQVANERGVIHDKIAEGGKYNTADVVDNIREGNYQVSDSIARPAIKAAEPGVRLVPISEVRDSMTARIKRIPASQIDEADRANLLKQVSRRYADDSAAAAAHPNGYSLTDLHDARIVSGKNGGYKIGQSASDALKAQRSREEGRVFADIFDKTVPEEVGMKQFRKELEKNFLLADYLESLNGKKVPAGITKKAVRLFGRAVTATVGGKVGGFPGSILGAQYGDMLFNSFEALPNPIKMKVLQSIKIEDPKIFKELVQYIGTKEAERLMTKGLPAAGGSSFKETPPTMFTTPGGVTTPIKGEAFDIGNVDTGKTKAPKTDRRLKSYLTKVQYAQDADGTYTPPDELPTIKVGPKKKGKKSLNDIL